MRANAGSNKQINISKHFPRKFGFYKKYSSFIDRQNVFRRRQTKCFAGKQLFKSIKYRLIIVNYNLDIL